MRSPISVAVSSLLFFIYLLLTFLHHRFFTFAKSTPQEIVGNITSSTFFTSTSSSSVTLLSNLGPTPSHKLRLPSPQLSGFIKSIPVVPATLADGAPQFLAVLREKNLVRDISLDDVFVDLSAHPLTVPEAVECFKWWTTLATNRSYDSRLLQRLKDGAMLSFTDSTGEEKIVPLGLFRTFVNPKNVPIDLPLPDHTLPFELTRQISHSDLTRVFGFAELGLVEWVKYLVVSLSGKDIKSEVNLLQNPAFAEKVRLLISFFPSLADFSAPHRLLPFFPRAGTVPPRLHNTRSSPSSPLSPSFQLVKGRNLLPSRISRTSRSSTTLPSLRSRRTRRLRGMLRRYGFPPFPFLLKANSSAPRSSSSRWASASTSSCN